MIRFVNNVKTAVMLAGLMALFLVVGAQFGQTGLIFAFVLGGVTNIAAWFFSDKIALAAMRAREIGPDSPGAAGELYHLVDELRQRAGLPMPKVCLCPHEAPNAFATGRSPRHAAVAVTEGAMRILNDDELRGVMAHELAHIKNRDTLTSCIAATISGVLAYLAHVGLMFGGGRREGGNPLVMLATVILAMVAAAMLKAMISRSREYVADHDGAVIAGSPLGLASALRRLEAYSKRIPLDTPNPAANNLFIVEPLTGSSILNLFASHPPTEKRIAALMSQADEMAARGHLAA
ncbi:MAG: protease HtpX [Phycisphaerae bacterium]|nr:MAG: protease HtpX [Phycisphaerae bacterium]